MSDCIEHTLHNYRIFCMYIKYVSIIIFDWNGSCAIFRSCLFIIIFFGCCFFASVSFSKFKRTNDDHKFLIHCIALQFSSSYEHHADANEETDITKDHHHHLPANLISISKPFPTTNARIYFTLCWTKRYWRTVSSLVRVAIQPHPMQ